MCYSMDSCRVQNLLTRLRCCPDRRRKLKGQLAHSSNTHDRPTKSSRSPKMLSSPSSTPRIRTGSWWVTMANMASFPPTISRWATSRMRRTMSPSPRLRCPRPRRFPPDPPTLQPPLYRRGIFPRSQVVPLHLTRPPPWPV